VIRVYPACREKKGKVIEAYNEKNHSKKAECILNLVPTWKFEKSYRKSMVDLKMEQRKGKLQGIFTLKFKR